MTAMQKRTTPQRIVADWERCAPILGEMRWWFLLNWMAAQPEKWHKPRDMNAVRGIGYGTLENAKKIYLIMCRRGILVRASNPVPSLRHTFLYTLSPSSRRLMGVSEAVPPVLECTTTT